MKDLSLNKESNENEIKRYFKAILKLSQSDNEFPVNLDDVWPLIYERRDSAVKALTRDFIEKEDYQPVRRKAERSSDGKFIGADKVDYLLTVPCLEYFIVKKVRPVFEVYRQVFHKAASSLPPARKKSAGLTTKVKASIMWVEGISRSLNLNDASKLRLFEQVAEPLGLPTPDYVKSSGILLSASTLLKRLGLSISARDFNLKMIERGMMKKKERPSSNKGLKKFNMIVGDGLKYGENSINPNNQKETQPLYYEEKFMELIRLLGIA